MNEIEIANLFIRAAEVDRADHTHVGPAMMRSIPLPYVHDWLDKAGWRKERGDHLTHGDDPLAAERKAFFESAKLPTSGELSRLERVYDLLLIVDHDSERRALLAWARSKAGGSPFSRWCRRVEGIHPETGRQRKNRAIARICAQLDGGVVQNCQNDQEGQLPIGPEIGDDFDTLDDDGRRSGVNSWADDDAFSPFIADAKHDFSWAEKRNERRRKRNALVKKRDEHDER